MTVVRRDQIRDQSMTSIADVVKYIPGVTTHQGENNRDEVIIRGNKSMPIFIVTVSATMSSITGTSTILNDSKRSRARTR